MECAKALKGRVDKKFCDDFCRNVYNNKLNSDTNTFVRNLTNVLRRNRRLLEEALQSTTEGMTRITRSKLLERGFQFKYMTHTYTNKKGNIYYFCFEFGYLQLEGDWLLVVKRNEEGV